MEKEEVIVLYGDFVIVDSFVVWRDRYEVEIVFERVKLMLEFVFMVFKEKKFIGW